MYDYHAAGAYFVTIVTKDFKHFFGTIENGQMGLNARGKEVAFQWEQTVLLGPDISSCPYPFHGIVTIGSNTNPNQPTDKKDRVLSKSLGAIINGVKGSVTRFAQRNHIFDFQWQGHYLDRVIRDEKEFWRIAQRTSGTIRSTGQAARSYGQTIL